MFLKELMFAFRQLRKAPGFTVLAIVTLVLGIGASTAMFTIVDSVLLKPLAYRDSGRLAIAWERVKFLGAGAPYIGPNPRHFDLWQKRADAFSGLTLLQQSANGVSLGAGHPQLTGAIRAYPNFLKVLQVQPVLGRDFGPENATPGKDKVAILSYGLWQNLFRGDPDVIGKTVRVSDVPREVIGVLPESFHFPNANALSASPSNQRSARAQTPALIVPAAINLNRFDWNGEYGNWIALGRLKPGASLAQAESQLNSIAAQIEREMPAKERDNEPNALLAFVQPMQEAVVGGSKMSLWLLMGAVMGLMLIACVNLANAQLGRALAREPEVAVRSALGAGRWQLLWNSWAEATLLAAAGGAGGVVLAYEALHLFALHAPVELPRLSEVHLNSVVLLFALGLMAGAAVLFGTVPALHFMRADPQRALQRNSGRTQGSRESRRLRYLLIGLQVFGSTALLLVTGLFTRSLLHLVQSDKGFDTSEVVAAEVDLPPKTYDKDQRRMEFDELLLRDLRAIPGVSSAALVSAMPLEGETWIDGIVRADRPGGNPPLANFRWVSPGYFETIRERLMAGRLFSEQDRNANSVVISQAAARDAWGAENPVGRQIDVHGDLHTVIGVVSDARNNSLKQAPANMAYFHFKDNPPYQAYFMIRSSRGTDSLAPEVRRAIWGRAPEATIARIKSMDSQLSDSLAPERFQTLVLLLFGAAALLLAMLGIYGVLSYAIAGRKREIGVRMALGATRQGIYALAMQEAVLPVAGGLLAGWAASIGVGRIVRSLLYGVGAADVEVSLAVAALFLLAAGVAAFVPARRAASVDPIAALRTE